MKSVKQRTILYLHSSSDLYGSDRSLLRTIQGLDRSLFEPVVCLPYDGPLVSELRATGITTYVFGLGVMRRNLFTPAGLIRFALELVKGTFRLTSIVKRHNVELIHSNTTAVLAGGIVSCLRRIHHIWHVREIIQRPVAVRKLIAWMLKNCATLVIGVSESVIENLEIDQPRIREKSKVVHNGLETAKFKGKKGAQFRSSLHVEKKDVLVGMIGRVGSWKGQELFLSVAQRVAREKPNVRFVAVGGVFKGNEEKMSKLVSEVEKAGLEGRFAVIDFRSDIADILAGLDIFVLPSTLPDPFPTTVLEAMAAGKGIVANAHGGVTEMLEEGRSGYLVEPNNADAMAGKLLLLAENRRLRQEIGAAAAARVREKFHVTQYLTIMNEIYKSFVS